LVSSRCIESRSQYHALIPDIHELEQSTGLLRSISSPALLPYSLSFQIHHRPFPLIFKQHTGVRFLYEYLVVVQRCFTNGEGSGHTSRGPKVTLPKYTGTHTFLHRFLILSTRVTRYVERHTCT